MSEGPKLDIRLAPDVSGRTSRIMFDALEEICALCGSDLETHFGYRTARRIKEAKHAYIKEWKNQGRRSTPQ